MNVQADLGRKIREMGAKFTREYFTGRFGLKPEEFTLEDETSPPEGATAADMNFSAPSGGEKTTAEKAQNNLDEAIVKMLPGAFKASAEFVTQIENEIRSAQSYEDLEEGLAALLSPVMAPDVLESFLARAMTMAAGHGAASVQTEAEEDD